MDKYGEACQEIARRVLAEKASSNRDVLRIKKAVSRRYSLSKIPSNPEIIRHSASDQCIYEILRLKPVRSISGIVILSTMTTPYTCPHGRCVFCPWYPGSPTSYTGKEPAAMRAIQNEFDPERQIRQRLKQLEEMGHYTQKVELIIQGGTFNATPLDYREEYMMGVMAGVIGRRPQTYAEALAKAEASHHRMVGMTLETRPDQASEEQVEWMLERGFTRVELGVQTVYDDTYDRIKRGHHLKEVVEATRRLKDAGYKVCYHLMPGLPGVEATMDLQAFKFVFQDEDLRPDQLKVYPTLVMKGTELYNSWRNGEYKPQSLEETTDLLIAAKANLIPKWVRVMRIQRDIPSHEIVQGIKKTNLRQLVQTELKGYGLRCRCIRCRESGHRRLLGEGSEDIDYEVTVDLYQASGGTEFFIAMENLEEDVIFGFLRLRKPSKKAWRSELEGAESLIIRELHVYGESLPLGEKSYGSWQHRGIGERLLLEAENMAIDLGAEKMVVLSGVGAREYYYKHGYARDGPYVSKELL